MKIIKVLRALTAQPDRLAAMRYNGLTQIIIEVLFRVGIARVELTKADMCHGMSVQFWVGRLSRRQPQLDHYSQSKRAG